MKSRFCANFTSGIPVSFNNNYSNTWNLKFTADFWQPFIETHFDNETALICGPLLGIIIEMSKILTTK
jgi:hypothetical protein